MANIDHTPEGQENPSLPAHNPPPLQARGMSRRRFAKAGLGGAGAILTVASAPGMACDICTTPSGSLSGGLQSRTNTTPVVCNGVSPGYWKTHSGMWSPTLQKTLFGASGMFSCSGTNASGSSCYKNTSLMKILSRQSFDKENLGMHLTATWLNIHYGKLNFLTKGNLQTIWNEWQMKGYYTPTAGVKWYAKEIVIYLKGTMD